MSETLSAAAAALQHSFETGDRSQWESHFAPGCVNWHNSDKLEVPAAGFGGGGALIRIVVRGTVRANGRAFEAHNAIVLTTNANGIVRIDDYVDPTFGDQLRSDAD